MILNLLLPFLATLATGLGPLSMHSSSNIAIDDCEIVEFYERIELDRGAKIIGAYGGVEEGEAVLVPTEVEVGNYEVSVRRIDQNYYQIEGTSTVIETNWCSEYATYGIDAVLMVESNYGYTKGSIIFE